jgi:transcriptional regulator with XRE-family HTH domain
MTPRESDLPPVEDLIRRRLRFLRQASDLSQGELAERLGLPRMAVVNVENGGRRLRVDELITCARIFGVDLEELISPGAFQVTVGHEHAA